MIENEWKDYWDRRDVLTEQDWLACPNSKPMDWFIQKKTSDRKMRLFASASCRRFWNVLDAETRREVEAWECFADGEITRQEFASASSGSWSDPSDYAWNKAKGSEGLAQANLLRDILGNVFRPITFSPSWLTPTVTSLASTAYEERALPSGELDTACLSVLADALEETGCDNADILNHLRGPGPHVRGLGCPPFSGPGEMRVASVYGL
jgi:hypothetical protein